MASKAHSRSRILGSLGGRWNTMTPHNNIPFSSKGSEDLATEITKNRRFWPPRLALSFWFHLIVWQTHWQTDGRTNGQTDAFFTVIGKLFIRPMLFEWRCVFLQRKHGALFVQHTFCCMSTWEMTTWLQKIINNFVVVKGNATPICTATWI